MSHSWGWNLSSIYVSKAEMFKPGWVHNFQFHVAWQRVPYAACSQKWYLRPHKGQSCATCRDTIQRSRQEFTRFHSDAAMQRPAASMHHKPSTCPNDALHGRWWHFFTVSLFMLLFITAWHVTVNWDTHLVSRPTRVTTPAHATAKNLCAPVRLPLANL